MGVVELTGIEAKLTKAVEGSLVTPLTVETNVDENVSSLGTVGIEVELTVPTDELVTSESFDGFDCFLDFHGWFGFHILIVPCNEGFGNPLVPVCQLAHSP